MRIKPIMEIAAVAMVPYSKKFYVKNQSSSRVKSPYKSGSVRDLKMTASFFAFSAILVKLRCCALSSAKSADIEWLYILKVGTSTSGRIVNIEFPVIFDKSEELKNC